MYVNGSLASRYEPLALSLFVRCTPSVDTGIPLRPGDLLEARGVDAADNVAAPKAPLRVDVSCDVPKHAGHPDPEDAAPTTSVTGPAMGTGPASAVDATRGAARSMTCNTAAGPAGAAASALWICVALGIALRRRGYSRCSPASLDR